MTGAEHCRLAEQLVASAVKDGDGARPRVLDADLVAVANVHALLAIAAAAAQQPEGEQGGQT